MNICMLTSSFPRTEDDPAGIFIYNLAKWLAKKNINVSVIAPHDKGCKFYETRDGFKIYRFPYFLPFSLQRLCYGSGIVKNIKEHLPILIQVPFFFLSQVIAATIIAKEDKADIIHAHWSIPQGFTGSIIKKILRIPFITTLHGSDVFSMQNSLMKALNAWILRQTDRCTANSRQTIRIAKQQSGREDIARIPMGVDTDLFKIPGSKNGLAKPEGTKAGTILYVGRLIDWKGVDYLIAAMPKVLVKYPDTKLYIVGDGPEQQRLNLFAEASGVKEQIIFTGNLSQETLKSYYDIADVFVLPSILHETGETEGMGVVLLEAMASGVPVIGSNVGGIGDVIKHETTGILVSQKDPDGIAEGILRLFEDIDFSKKLTCNGRRFVETRFSWDVISDKFIRLYREIQHSL